MSESKSDYDNVFLNSVRNATILLLVGIALLEFGGRLSKIAPIVFILVIFLLLISIYNYWKTPGFSNYPIVFIVIGITEVAGWLLYESFLHFKGKRLHQK